MITFMKERVHRFLFACELAYGGVILAMQGMREMDEACNRQASEV